MCVCALERELDIAFPPAPLSIWGEATASVLRRAQALKCERAVALKRARVLQPMVAIPENQAVDLVAVC